MNWKRIKAALTRAFEYDDGRDEISEEDIALLDRVAHFVVRRRMVTPATLLIETVGPLNFLGSSMMTFLRPIVGIAFDTAQYERLERLMEKRCSPRLLIERIEFHENEYLAGRREPKDPPSTPRDS